MTIADEYEFHPVANIFPMMEEADRAELAEDIRKHGLFRPIALFEGKIIDGRNRYLACISAQALAHFTEPDIEDPIAYVLSQNLHRRHLKPSQRAIIGDKVRAYYDEQAKERMLAGTQPNPVETLPQGKARDQAGAAVGVSGRTMDKAKKVREQGSKQLIKAVEAGRIDVTTAEKLVALPKQQQETILEDAERNQWSGRQIAQEARRLTPYEAAPKIKESELTGDSYNLQNLKQFWQRASKKDRKRFLVWIGEANDNHKSRTNRA